MEFAEDTDILALYRARDQKAISETDKKFGTLCRRIAQGILGSPEDAEECCNDALYRVWEAIPPAAPSNLGAYCVTTVRNIACNRRAKGKTQKRGSGEIPAMLDELAECVPDRAANTPLSALEMKEMQDALNRFLGTITPEARTMFILRYWGGMSITDIMKKCGSGRSSVKMTLMRTRNKLKAFLREEDLL